MKTLSNINDLSIRGETKNELLIETLANEKIENLMQFKDFLRKNPTTNINATDQYGYTPLMYASSQKDDNQEIAKELLKIGANPNHKALDKKSAIVLAKFNGNTKIYNLLKSYGADESIIENYKAFPNVKFEKNRKNDISSILKASIYTENKNPRTLSALNDMMDFLNKNSNPLVKKVLTMASLFCLEKRYENRGVEIFTTSNLNIDSMTSRVKHNKTRGMHYIEKNALLLGNIEKYQEGAKVFIHEAMHNVRRSLSQKNMPMLFKSYIDLQSIQKSTPPDPFSAWVNYAILNRIEFSQGYYTMEQKLEELIADLPKAILHFKSTNKNSNELQKSCLNPLMNFFDKTMSEPISNYIENHPKKVLINYENTLSNQHKKNDIKKDFTPLENAIITGEFDICQKHIEAKENIHNKSVNGFTPLFLVVISQNKKWDKYLKRNNKPTSTQIIESLVNAGLNVNQRAKNGSTPLMYACEKAGGFDNVKLLLDRGADVNLKDNNGHTAREYALLKGNTVIGKEISKRQFNLQDKKNRDFLFDVKNNTLDEKTTLSDKNLNIQDEDGYTPLMYAIKNNNLNVTKKLLQHGAKTTPRDNLGRDAFLNAILNKNHKAVLELINANASIKTLDYYGKSPMIIAAESGNTNMIIFLEKNYNANINDISSQLRTPLIHAIEMDNIDSAKKLIDLGANVNQADVFGITPLICSTIRNDLKTARVLLEKSTNINATDQFNNTALHIALRADNKEMVKLLLSFNPNIDLKDAKGKTAREILKDKDFALSSLTKNKYHKDITRTRGSGELILH